jgi:T4-like virus Myoviridae tail sheath stabiliser
MVPELGLIKDVPVVLTNVGNAITYEGDFDSVRYVNWTLTFSVQMHYYGPISYPKIIRTVYANIYNDPRLRAGYIVRINTNELNANSTFKIEDMVYQGDSLRTAKAQGVVVSWNPDNGRLVIGAAQGQFMTNNTIRAVSTNASCNIASFAEEPMKLAEIKITPDPSDAGPEDDYGYNIEITEWPKTE